MPLPTAVPRKHMHTRDIQCCGYERDDGLWDIEGHLVDTKAFSTTARDTGRATTAFPATHRARENHNAATPQSAKRPFPINACHMYKEDGDWVKERWPQWYTGK